MISTYVRSASLLPNICPDCGSIAAESLELGFERNQQRVQIVGDSRHGDVPPRQLIVVARRRPGKLERLEGHLAAVIVGADLVGFEQTPAILNKRGAPLDGTMRVASILVQGSDRHGNPDLHPGCSYDFGPELDRTAEMERRDGTRSFRPGSSGWAPPAESD